MEEREKTSERADLYEEYVPNGPVGVAQTEAESEIAAAAELVPAQLETAPLEETGLTEITETVTVSAKAEKKESRAKNVLRAHFTAPRIAYMALFTALAYVVTFLEFPIFPAAPFLKFDFANVFFMFEGFIFGPVEAIVSIGIKELLCFADSQTGGVGEIANFLMSLAYIVIPSIGYRFLKGRKWVTVFLVIACFMQMGISILANRYINFPFFMGAGAAATFQKLWYYVLAFNAIKSIGISIVVFLLYKPLSRFIKMTSDKFDKKLAAAKRRRAEAKEKPAATE